MTTSRVEAREERLTLPQLHAVSLLQACWNGDAWARSERFPPGASGSLT